MLFIPTDLRIVSRHCFNTLVPVRHADGQTIGFGRRGQGFARAVLRQLEGVTQYTIHAATGEDRLLDNHLVFRPFTHASAERRVFSLGVLAYDVEINVAWLLARQWARDSREQAYRTQVDVLVEFAAKLKQRAP